jgi:hypothetical protein
MAEVREVRGWRNSWRIVNAEKNHAAKILDLGTTRLWWRRKR